MWWMLTINEPKNLTIVTGNTQSLKDFLKSVFEAVDFDWRRMLSQSKLNKAFRLPEGKWPSNEASCICNGGQKSGELNWLATGYKCIISGI